MSSPLDSVISAVFLASDYVLRPLDLVSARIGLVCFSVASGAGLLWLFGKFSNQKMLARTRDRISAAIYEVRLFIDSPRRIVSAQARILYWSLRYVLLTIPPISIIAIPLGLLWPHLEARYGLQPLPTDRPVLLRVVQTEAAESLPSLRVPDGVELTAPPLHIHGEKQTYFRLRLSAGVHELSVELGGSKVTKQLVADTEASRVSAGRAAGFRHLLSIGNESVVSSRSGIDRIEVHHEPREVGFVGLRMPWWIAWLVLSTISALLLRKRMRVVL